MVDHPRELRQSPADSVLGRREAADHRLGDFVFTYHGFDLSTANAELWIVVEVPEQRAPGTTTFGIGYADGSTTQLAILDSGEFFGEAALLGNEIRTATATALSTLKLLRLTRRSIQQLAKEQPEIEAQLAEAVLRRAGRLSPGSRH